MCQPPDHTSQASKHLQLSTSTLLELTALLLLRLLLVVAATLLGGQNRSRSTELTSNG